MCWLLFGIAVLLAPLPFYCYGMARYAELNSSADDEEKRCKHALDDELDELQNEIDKGNVPAAVLEFFDVLTAQYKLLVVRHFGKAWLSSYFVWVPSYFFALPAGLKLARRQYLHGCVRSHRNQSRHRCDYKE